jgi:mono/diheme cytochrome c family protein
MAVLLALMGVVTASVWVRSEASLHHRYALPATTVTLPVDPAAVAEGGRLARVYGCVDGCHGRDGAGAVFFDQPLIARLVAPDLSAAASRYSDAELVNIIRHGLRPDGRSVFVMPAQAFVHLTDDDAARIVAFLRTLPAHDGITDRLSLGPIGRLGVATGKFRTAAQLIETAVPAPAARTELGERGRYLALSICSECHGQDLMGDETPDFVAPALGVVAAYSAEEFRRLMRTGKPIGDRTLGVMRQRAQQGLSHLTDAEIDALYEYLRALGSG